MYSSCRDGSLSSSPAFNSFEQDSDSFAIPENLPPYDKALGTRKILIAVLVVSFLLSLICIGFGTHSLAATPLCYNQDYVCSGAYYFVDFRNGASVTAVDLVFTVVNTICTEGLGYIHTISLRWALARDGHLEFNSNLRLFSATQSSAFNGVFANVLSGMLLIMCYTGASQMLSESNFTKVHYISVNSMTMLCFGVGLFGLSIITALGLRWGEKSGAVLSWNPDPLNTALACLHHGLLKRRPGRPFASAAQASDATVRTLSRPSHRQSSAQMTVPNLRHVTRALFATLLLICIAACAIMAAVLAQRYEYMTTNRFGLWHWVFFSTTATSVDWSNMLTINITGSMSNYGRSLFVFLFGCISQALSTLALHVAELVVNIHRDEAAWRKAYPPANSSCSKGARVKCNAIQGAIGNKGSVLLFCLKPLAQWMYSLGFSSSGEEIYFNALPLFVLAGLMAILAIVVFISARSQPRGPQPSTFGHLQTLVDSIDDWGDGAASTLWWGDKGVVFEDCWGLQTRRVGTSASKGGVSEIRMTGFYTSA